jgi:hypothetical protein
MNSRRERARMLPLSVPQSSAKFCLNALQMKKGGLTAALWKKKTADV